MTTPVDLQRTLHLTENALRQLATDFPQIGRMSSFNLAVLYIFIAQTECAELEAQ